MRPTLLKACCAALCLGAAAFALWGLPATEVVEHATAKGAAEIAARLNIRNLVSVIYLGPRAVDTFLEVLVVTLAVIGMQFVGERQ